MKQDVVFFMYIFLFSYLTWVDHSVFDTVHTDLSWCPWWGVQTVRCYPDRNWLWGLCHPLHLPQQVWYSNGVNSKGNNFWTLQGIEPGTLCTRVKDLNHCAMLLLLFLCLHVGTKLRFEFYKQDHNVISVLLPLTSCLLGIWPHL